MTATATKSSRLCRTGWVGVDMGTAALKVAQVACVRGQWSLQAGLVIPAERQGGIGLSPAVCALLADTAAFQGSRAACALPASAVQLRTMELPSGAESEVREMVAQELEAGGNFNADQMEFDVWELESPANNEGMCSYAVLSVSRHSAQTAADDLLAARLKCEAIDGMPFALARAASMSNEIQPGEPAAFVDWGHTSVTFVAVAEGKPIFVRSLRSCEFGLTVKRLSDKLNLTPEECRPLLVNYGLPPAAAAGSPTGLQEAIAEYIADPVAGLVDEISRTLSFAGRQLTRRAPRSVLLVGGGATIRNIAPHLSARLRQPVQTWRLPEAWPSAPSGETTALLAVAAGLSRLGVAS